MARRLDWEKANALEKARGGLFGKLPALSSPGDPREKFKPSFTRKKGVATTPFDAATLASERWDAERSAKKRKKKARKAAARANGPTTPPSSEIDTAARLQRRRYPIDLMEFMSRHAIGTLARHLRDAPGPEAPQLGRRLSSALIRGNGKVVVLGLEIEQMLNALPRKPALRHLRRTLGSIAAERDRRISDRLEQGPRRDLINNDASGGRKQRARVRDGRFWPS